MLKRLMNFLLFSTGITPKDHAEKDKYAEIRARRAEWERLQQAREDSAGSHLHHGGTEWVHSSAGDHGEPGGGDGGGGDCD